MGRYLPAGSRDGQAVLDVPDGSTVADLTRHLGIPEDLSHVVLVNGRDGVSEQVLAPDDVVVIFPPLAGGR